MDTYNFNYAFDEIEEIKSKIKKYFKEINYIELNTLIDKYKKDNKVNNNIIEILIYKAINELLNNRKELIKRNNGDIGFITYIGNNYIFQSIILNKEYQPIYYRNKLKTIRRNKVRINKFIEIKDEEKKKSLNSSYILTIMSYFKKT